MWFSSEGYIKYYKNGWIVLYCDPEIQRYYLYMMKKMGVSLQRPKYGAHVVINYGAEPLSNIELWKYNDGASAFFLYSNDIETDGRYYWLPVYSDDINATRNFFSLPKLWVPLHFSIGRVR